MRLTVAIPSYQRRSELARLLDSLDGAVVAAACEDEVEVLVVLDGSDDGSKEMVAARGGTSRYPVRVVWQPNSGAATARNRLAQEAAGELIWFIDDDMVVDETALLTHLRWDRDETTVLMGPCAIFSEDARQAKAREWYDRRWRKLAEAGRVTEVEDLTFANCSMPLTLARAHPFSEQFVGYGPEDVELAIRILESGIEVGYSADAEIAHEYDPSSDERLRKLRQEGRNRMLLLELHPEHRELVFGDDPGRFERALRRIGRPPAATPLWALARAIATTGRLPVGEARQARLQVLAETAALYSGIAGSSTAGATAAG